MDDERARRLVARLLAAERGEEFDRLVGMLALCGAAADDAVREQPKIARALARHRAAALTRAEVAAAIAGGADLEALPLDDELYRYLVEREDGETAEAIDRLCKRDDTGFELAWFRERAAGRIRRHAIARASEGDAFWFPYADATAIARFADDAERGPSAVRTLAIRGDREAIARQAREDHAVAALCESLAAARARNDTDGEALLLAALDRAVALESDATMLGTAVAAGCAKAIDPLIAAGASRLVVMERLTSFAARARDPRLVAAVDAALRDRSITVIAAGFALASAVGADAVAAIVATCDRTDSAAFSGARLDACRAIGRPACAGLEGALLGARDPEARAQAAALLGALGDPDSAAAMIAATEDPEAPVRAAALRALAQLARPTTEPAFAAYVRGTEDTDPDVRVRAAQILGGNRDPRAIAALRRCYDAADEATKPRLRPFIPKSR